MSTPSPLTTVRTIRRGEGVRQGSEQQYYVLTEAPGESHLLRGGSTTAGTEVPARSLAYLAHLTDIQLVDVQSPGRVEAMHALGRRPDTRAMLPMLRPQELLVAHATDAVVRALAAASTSARTGATLQVALTTGDNVDNMQHNEMCSFLTLLSGGRFSLDSGGRGYEGVQDGRYPWAWAPDDPENLWGRAHGFPSVPGLLTAGLRPFQAAGLHLDWLTCYGNHDGLVQGRVPSSPELAQILVGDRKVIVPVEGVADFTRDPLPYFDAASIAVTPDPDRRPATRREFVEAHFTGGFTHGLTERNRADGTAYYGYDVGEVRILVLDTTNPAGVFEGSIDRVQLDWLRSALAEAEEADRPVLVASHHPRSSMTNDRPVPAPHPEAGERVLGAEVAELLAAHPHVLAWISGHIHRNRIRYYRSAVGGFWEISTASIMDWPSQARLIEVIAREDGTIGLLSTVVDHRAPLRPGPIDSVDALAAWHRELAANDPLGVGGFDAEGTPADRNVELLLPDPRRTR